MCSVVLTLDLSLGEIGDEDSFKREVAALFLFLFLFLLFVCGGVSFGSES